MIFFIFRGDFFVLKIMITVLCIVRSFSYYLYGRV
nr:MAG TPA: hypothetical protein [Caudoviricetes sp.]